MRNFDREPVTILNQVDKQLSLQREELKQIARLHRVRFAKASDLPSTPEYLMNTPAGWVMWQPGQWFSLSRHERNVIGEVIRQMEIDGLIETHRDFAGRRVMAVRMTVKGKTVLRASTARREPKRELA